MCRFLSRLRLAQSYSLFLFTFYYFKFIKIVINSFLAFKFLPLLSFFITLFLTHPPILAHSPSPPVGYCPSVSCGPDASIKFVPPSLANCPSRCVLSSVDHLTLGVAFSAGPDGEHFRLCGPCGLCCSCLPLPSR